MTRKAPTKILISKSILIAAFDVIFATDDFLGNLIATGNPSSSDLNLKKKSEKYLKWHKKNVLQS